MLALQGLTPASLADALPGVTLAEARKVVSAVHRDRDLSLPVRDVRRVALDLVRRHGHTPGVEVVRRVASAVDPFVKFLLRSGGDAYEAVRIPLERAGRYSVCVSSQVGCAMKCGFCATGRLGLLRNLETWEIVEQVRIVRRDLAREQASARVHGVVFQGMGEPLANVDRVLEAIAILTEPSALAIDGRAITVCTSGLPSPIRRLADEAPNVRLGVSIGSARPEVRREIMPIDLRFPLAEVVDACVVHAQKTRLRPMWALTLLAGVNDTDADAEALASLAAGFAERAGALPRISVIPFNPIDAPQAPGAGDAAFERTGEEREAAFRAILSRAGVPTHRRYSGGGDVFAACGQLAGRG
jgi:23S rRNA (adenine2503-C2)-methyltransferase